jgi:hypothetical protein
MLPTMLFRFPSFDDKEWSCGIIVFGIAGGRKLAMMERDESSRSAVRTGACQTRRQAPKPAIAMPILVKETRNPPPEIGGARKPIPNRGRAKNERNELKKS